MAREITGKLDKIEARVTGRDCCADWRTQTK
jgi:hypothetical protein